MIDITKIKPITEIPYEPSTYSTGEDVPLYWPEPKEEPEYSEWYQVPECFK